MTVFRQRLRPSARRRKPSSRTPPSNGRQSSTDAEPVAYSPAAEGTSVPACSSSGPSIRATVDCMRCFARVPAGAELLHICHPAWFQ